MSGILASGVAFPSLRLAAKEVQAAFGHAPPRDVETLAIPAFDEDTITLAAEAAKSAVLRWGGDVASISSVFFATSGPERGAAIVSRFVGASRAQAANIVGAHDAGTHALQAARDAAARGIVLVVLSDVPRAKPGDRDESTSGGAAAALILAPAAPFPAASALAPDARRRLGSVGVAEAGLALVSEFSVPDGRAVSYQRSLAERRLISAGTPKEPMGAFVSLEAFDETIPARWRLVARRCADCGRVAYPPRAACAACGATQGEDVALSGNVELYSFTVIGQGGAPSEFAEQQAVTGAYAMGLVEFREGPRVAALLADVDATDLAIGMKLRPVFRRLYEQQNVVRYGLKFRPA